MYGKPLNIVPIEFDYNQDLIDLYKQMDVSTTVICSKYQDPLEDMVMEYEDVTDRTKPIHEFFNDWINLINIMPTE